MAYDLKKLASSPNIAAGLSDEERSKIARQGLEGYMNDDSSRDGWKTMMANATKLALQVIEEKTDPWVGASNIAFPLVTIAALNWHARAYGLLINTQDLVKVRTFGEDRDGRKTKAAKRVSNYMTWQLLEGDEYWVEDHDKALLVQAIMGCAFKKTWWDPLRRKVTSRLVFPQDLVVNYWCKNEVDAAPRATHVIPMSSNDIYARVSSGKYIGYDSDERAFSNMEPDITPMEEATIAREGVERPPLDRTTPHEMLEQLTWLDMDEDGYEEPYVLTIDKDKGKIRRLVARYTMKDVEQTSSGKVISINQNRIYTMYPFIPSPDGGFYPLGFGRLLGPINDSVNSYLNMLADAATLNNYGGGFLGRGARFRDGDNIFKPQEWKSVESSGDDLRKNIVPRPPITPDKVLFDLVQYLVGYGERVASSNEIQMGENPGQNTPAETMRTMNENGQRVFAATYMRTWRAQRGEFQVIYDYDRLFLSASAEFADVATGQGALVTVEDFTLPRTAILPSADPAVASKERQRQSAQILVQNAMSIPGHNKYKAIRRWYEALEIPNIDEVFPPPKPQQQQPGMPGQPQQQGGAGMPQGMPQGQPQGEPDIPTPPNPKLLDAMARQATAKTHEMDVKLKWKSKAVELKQAAIEIQGIVMEKRAKAIKLMAEAKSEASAVELQHLELEIKAHEIGLKHVMDAAELMMKDTEKGAEDGGSQAGANTDGGGAGAQGMAPPPGHSPSVASSI